MAKHRQWPKKKRDDGIRGGYLVDLDKLKDIYLSGPDYEWAPFCRRNNFCENTCDTKWKKRGFHFPSWKKEWLQKQSILQDEELAPEVLNLRKTVSRQRIRYVGDWNARSQYMKTLLDAMLRRHGEALQYDMQNPGQQKRFRLEPKELSDFASAAQRIQEIETRALLLTGDKMNHPQIMAGGTVGYQEDDPDQVPVMEVTTMGASGMSASETAKLLASWFDQTEKAKDEPKKDPE